MPKPRDWQWMILLALVVLMAGRGQQTPVPEGGAAATQVAQPTAIPTVTATPKRQPSSRVQGMRAMPWLRGRPISASAISV
ncbi:MAG TPA: hypothetical protein VGP82_05860 [Ktedonobacterales bacterium]|jgi:hypothetical protein|nr:hypothetical protein [Ktedonobacterales bacterium]